MGKNCTSHAIVALISSDIMALAKKEYEHTKFTSADIEACGSPRHFIDKHFDVILDGKDVDKLHIFSMCSHCVDNLVTTCNTIRDKDIVKDVNLGPDTVRFR